jgi:hypothetical protein
MSPRRLGVIGIALLLTAVSTVTAEPPAVKAAPSLELVPADSAAFVHIRIADLWDSPLGTQLRAAIAKDDPQAEAEMGKQIGMPVANVATLTFVFPKFDDAGSQVIVLVTTRAPYDKDNIKKAVLAAAPLTNGAGLDMYVVHGREVFAILDDRTFCIGSGMRPDEAALLVQRLKPPATKATAGPLRAALDRAAGKPVSGGLNVKSLPPFPPGFTPPPPLDALMPLLKANLMSMAFDPLGPQATLAVRADFPAGDAAAGEQAARDGIKMLVSMVAQLEGVPIPPGPNAELFKQLFQDAKTAVGKIEIGRDQSAVTVKLATPALAARRDQIATTVATGIRQVRESAERMREMNNLKQIALAMHNYHSATGAFPAHAIYSKDGKTPLLSWRVAILPYLEQDALFKEFKLDEPWDSEHNKKLIPRMPQVYLAPKAPLTKEPGWTHYRVFVDGGALFDRTAKGPRLTEIADGTSNTFLAVEAADAVPWTKPDDLVFNPAKPLPKLGADPKGGGFVAVLCDGSVRFVKKSVAEMTLKAMITRGGGEAIGPNDLDN